MKSTSLYRKIFPNPKTIIGMIALPPLLGYPEFSGVDAVIERALDDLDTLQEGGVDGVCVENDYDRPHQIIVGPEIVATLRAYHAGDHTKCKSTGGAGGVAK